MENKSNTLLFSTTVIIIFALMIILVKDFKAARMNDFKAYTFAVTKLVRVENYRMRVLVNRLVAEQKENQELKNTLADTRNALDALTKKLAQPVPVAAPASVPAPAAVVQ